MVDHGHGDLKTCLRANYEGNVVLKLWGLKCQFHLELTMYVRMAICLACKESMNNIVDCAYLYNAISLGDMHVDGKGDTKLLRQTTPRNAVQKLFFKVNLT